MNQCSGVREENWVYFSSYDEDKRRKVIRSSALKVGVTQQSSVTGADKLLKYETRERILATVVVTCQQYLISTSTCVLCLGESVPVNKTSLPRLTDAVYDPKEDVSHTLFCGTKVSSVLLRWRLVTWLVCLNEAYLNDIYCSKG